MGMAAMESIERLQQRIDYELGRQNYPENFPPLPELPAERYVSQEFYELERKYLWPNSWLYAGHKDQFPVVGSYMVFDQVPGMPVVIVRDEDCYRAFYNTCSHRGGCLVIERQGVCAGKRLKCGYHAWTYDFNGKLIGIPDQADFHHIDKSKRGLTKLRCETWSGWVFINADLDAAPLTDQLGTVREQMDQFDPDRLTLINRYHYDVACNWKVLMDAFAENYHFVSVHKGTVGLPGPACAVRHRGTVMSLYENGNSRNILPWNVGFEPRTDASEGTGFSMGMGGIEEIPSVGPIPRKFITAFTCFPNLTTPVYANGFPLLLFWPTGLNTSRFEIIWFGLPHGAAELPPAWREKIAAFNVILDEDLTFLPSVQKSAESPAFRAIQLSYQERRIYHAHEQIDRTIGPERIPERLRVKPVLASLVEA
jgi:phenylpropionate dioxygenase-like ring-hydroxylating dioxygenase large terminal subunit